MGEELKRSNEEARAAGAKTTEGTIGLEDLTRSVRALLRSGRSLSTSTLEVAERELAMAIGISESIRDDIVTRESLQRARHKGVMASFRNDGHRMVDLIMDVGSIAVNSGLDFLENFADQHRPPLAIDSRVDKEKKSK
jgi:hypothetical protein